MFFFFPVGSEEGVRRLPYITIALIAVNTIIYFITSMAVTRQIDRLWDLQTDLQKIEVRYAYYITEENSSLLQEHDPDKIHEYFYNNNIIPEESSDYEKWHRLYAEYQDVRSGFVYDKYGFTPKHFSLIKIFTSMFIHAGFFHLLFNMLYLWLVGCNIEDDWSWPFFLGLYLVSGFFAVLLHTAFFPKSTMPLVGASGAIAGIMGAFMVRHFKTKIRFAYFIWVIIARPFMGTFSVYAGVALPLWFLIEIACAPGSGEASTAHWAHIGGFAFGALVGSAMKFLKLEKKYVAPLVEDTFEKLKMSYNMKEATRKMDEGDFIGAQPLFLAVLAEEPDNFDAPLILARHYYESGKKNDAAEMYNNAVTGIIRNEDVQALSALVEELKEKSFVEIISEKNAYNSAALFEKKEDYHNATIMYGVYIRLYPEGKVRAKAIHRTYLIFKSKLHNPSMAQHSLEFLQKEYPDFPVPTT